MRGLGKFLRNSVEEIFYIGFLWAVGLGIIFSLGMAGYFIFNFLIAGAAVAWIYVILREGKFYNRELNWSAGTIFGWAVIALGFPLSIGLGIFLASAVNFSNYWIIVFLMYVTIGATASIIRMIVDTRLFLAKNTFLPMFQVIFLQESPPSRWWISANIIGWGLGVGLALIIASYVGSMVNVFIFIEFMGQVNITLLQLFAGLITGLLGGFIAGVLTATAEKTAQYRSSNLRR